MHMGLVARSVPAALTGTQENLHKLESWWQLTLSLGVRINKERWGLRQTREPGPLIMTQHNYRPLLPKVLTLENLNIRLL